MVREELEQHLTEAQYELTQTLLDLQVSPAHTDHHKHTHTLCCVQAEREKSQSLGERLGGMTAKLNNMEMATAVSSCLHIHVHVHGCALQLTLKPGHLPIETTQ